MVNSTQKSEKKTMITLGSLKFWLTPLKTYENTISADFCSGDVDILLNSLSPLTPIALSAELAEFIKFG